VETVKLKPLFNIVLCEQIVEEKKSEGGIVLPDLGKGNTIEARVVATGPGCVTFKDDEMNSTFSVGEIVVFNKYRYEGDKAIPNLVEVVVAGRKLLAVEDTNLIGTLVE